MDELVEKVSLAVEEAIEPKRLTQGYYRAAATAAIEASGIESLQQRLAEVEGALERAAENLERLQVPHIVGRDVHNFAFQAAKAARSALSTEGASKP